MRGLSFDVARGEIVCLLGPSGSGKTTLLRIIAGLDEADHASIHFADEDMAHVPTHRRGFGLMFQDLALFPHRDVFDNVAFGLRMQNQPRALITRRVQEALETVGLGGFAARDVIHLSGGEQQRVALARALAPYPRLLMLDEPLGALDRILRESLVVDLRRILKSLGMTSIYVTHDQSEAFAIADRILIMRDGQIVASGTPRELYQRPADAFVARFLGLENLLNGRLVRVEPPLISTDEGEFVPTLPAAVHGPEVQLMIPTDSALSIDKSHSQAKSENTIQGKVVEARFQVGRQRVVVESAHGRLLAFESNDQFEPGTPVCVSIDPKRILVLGQIPPPFSS